MLTSRSSKARPGAAGDRTRESGSPPSGGLPFFHFHPTFFSSILSPFIPYIHPSATLDDSPPPHPSSRPVPPPIRTGSISSQASLNLSIPPTPTKRTSRSNSTMANNGGVHLRRRSSVTVSSGNSTPSPWLAQGQYDPASGEIRLPPSPPLFQWKDSAAGLWDEKKGSGKGHLLPYLPPYVQARGGPIRKPWMFILSVCGATLVFVTIISFVAPSSTSYGTSALLSRIPFKMSSSHCSPYSSFGTLNVDSLEADKNQWIPFDKDCRPPAFLSKLRHSNKPSDFSWLYNRTALIIGDSISREHVENFCQLMGEESEVVRKHHKYSATSTATRGAVKAGHTLDKPARLVTRGARVIKDASLPRICYIPKYDFLLASVFHFGLDQEDYWRESRMPQYVSPGMFEHRLADVVQPLLSAFRQDGRLAAPDFVEVSSGMWDLARWAQQDTAEQRDTEAGLSADRVAWYRFRVGQVLEAVRKAFPNAKARTWRTMHYPLDQNAEQDYFMDKISQSTTNYSASSSFNPYFAHNRIYQLDQAVRSLVLPESAPHSDFKINEWGTILKGRDAHQKDRLHGDPLPGGYIWSDIMLHELHEGVTRGDAHSRSFV